MVDPLERINQGRRVTRWIIIVVLLLSAGPGVMALLDQFAKMSAPDVQIALDARVGRGRDVRCEPGANGWDYFCTYVANPKLSQRLKIGVRVDHSQILAVSQPSDVNARFLVQ